MNRFYFILILTLFSTFCQAQFEHATWYFGKNAGVDFSSGVPVGITDGQIDTNEGCASISDDCGNLLFYTDGRRVYNQNHAVMQNGYGLSGNATSTQSAVIVPNPANRNQYYIFTIFSISGFYYSLADMTLDGGNGGLVAGQKNIQIPILTGYRKCSEKITIAKTADCNGYWIITHALDKFYAFKITESGLNTTPVISTVGMHVPLVWEGQTIGYLKASPDSKKLAIAHKDITTDGGGLAVYDFDNLTGTVSNEKVLYQPTSVNSLKFYGVEFSPNQRFLYATTEYSLNQYDLNAANIPQSQKVVSSANIGALQLGVDRKIYYTNYDSYFLSVINDPNQLLDPIAGTNPDFVPNNVFLEGKAAHFGLPTFTIPYTYKGKIAINAIDKKCAGNNCQVPLSFEFLGCPDASLVWDFGDGNTSTAVNPVHNYASIGTYTVLLTYTLKGHTYTTTTEITVHPLPNPQNAELKKCPDFNGNNITFDLTEAYPQINPAGQNVTFSFHLTEQDAKDKINTQPLSYSTASPFIFWVRVENEWGCFSVVQLNLLFHTLPVFNTSTPIKICENNTAQLDVNTALGNTVNWFDSQSAVTPIFSGNSFTTPILTNTRSYWVEVFNGNCYAARSEIVVAVEANPQVSITPYSGICEGTSITLTATSPGNVINWYLDNVSGIVHFTGGSFVTGNLMATTSFWVEAVNSVTGCKSDKTEIVVTVSRLLTPTFNAISPICPGEPLTALPTVSIEGITGTWSPALDNTQTTTYSFMPDAGQCAIGQVMVITVNPSVMPTFNAISPICAGEPLTALQTVSLEGITGTWSPALDNTQTTTYTFTPNAGQCANSQAMVITVNPSVTPTFNTISPICAGESLTALPIVSLEGITGTWSPALDNTQTTTYTFTPDAGQCANSQTMVITVNPSVTPTFNTISPICSGEPLTTLPTVSIEGINGTWSPALDNTQTTTYSFMPDPGQCARGSVSMTIVVNPLLTPVFNIPTTYCQNALPIALPLTSDNGITGSWLPAQIDTALAGTTVYEFSPDLGECAIGKIVLNITVTGSNDPVFNIRTAYCQNASPSVLPGVSDNGITGSWNPNIIDTAIPGVKTYTFTSTPNDCSIAFQYELIVEVSAAQTAVFNLITDYYFVESPQVLPTVSDNGITGIWYPAVISPNTSASGTYRFIPDADQCAEVFSVKMTVINYPAFFTPNNDGYHDLWNISALQSQSNATILIYDRFGKILKMIQTQDAGWDGTYQGKQMPSDDYWFVLKYLDNQGLQREHKAHFALKR